MRQCDVARRMCDSFTKEPDNRDYILQKRLIILGSLLIVAPPYEKTEVLCTIAEFYI